MKLSLIVLIVAFSAVIASGHTCVNIAGYPEPEFRLFLDKTNSIFFGEVVELEPADGLKQVVRVKIMRSWKGAQDPEVSLRYQGIYAPFEK
jgi:hypothetical protein